MQFIRIFLFASKPFQKNYYKNYYPFFFSFFFGFPLLIVALDIVSKISSKLLPCFLVLTATLIFYPKENLFPASFEVLKAYGLLFSPIEEYDYTYEKGYVLHWHDSSKYKKTKTALNTKKPQPSPIRFFQLRSSKNKFSPQFKKFLSLHRKYKKKKPKTPKVQHKAKRSRLETYNYPYLQQPFYSSDHASKSSEQKNYSTAP